MKNYLYGLSIALMTVSLCSGMSSWERDWEKEKSDRKALEVRFDDSEVLGKFERYAHALKGWRSQWENDRRKMQQGLDSARLLQERLHCYPECASAQFIEKDEVWNPLRDAMDALVAAITDEEVQEIQVIKKKLDNKEFNTITDADIACIIAATQKYDVIRKADRAIEDKLKTAVLAAATMSKMIEKKDKKCIVM